MIILHRPPSNMFDKPGVAESEDVEVCYESLQAILRLLRSFSRFYRYRSLPLDFVQTLATATGIVLMKRYLQKASWTDPDIERSLSLLLEAMNDIQNTWPPVREIRDSLVRAQQTQPALPPEVPFTASDLMTGLQMDVTAMSGGEDGGAGAGTGDVGAGDTAFMAHMNAGSGGDFETLITDEFLSAQLQVSEPALHPFDFSQMPGLT